MQFIRYASVGLIGFAIDVGLISIFVELFKIDEVLAASFAFISTTPLTFFLNRHWTFKNKEGEIPKQFIKFFSISLLGLIATAGSMAFFSKILELHYILARTLTGLVMVISNFLLNKYVTFGKNHEEVQIVKKDIFL